MAKNQCCRLPISGDDPPTYYDRDYKACPCDPKRQTDLKGLACRVRARELLPKKASTPHSLSLQTLSIAGSAQEIFERQKKLGPPCCVETLGVCEYLGEP